MSKDIFCKIISGESFSFRVYETDLTLAFLDIEPGSEGYTLIVPKRHAKDITELTDSESHEIMDSARIITRALKEVFDYKSVGIFSTNGDISQEVLHFHMHVYGKYQSGQELDYFKSFTDDKDKFKSMKRTATQLRDFISRM